MKKLTQKHKEALKKGWIKRKAKGLGNAWNKGKTHSKEHKKNLAKAWIKRKEKGLGDPWNKGKKLSPEHAAKCRIANLGKKASLETRKKLSESRTGKKNWAWKGDDAGYWAIHGWINRRKGSAKKYKCKHCGEQAQHWANIDHKCRRVEEDYIPLCCKCHKKFDGYGE